jgi:uncharacterized protein YndB with AHSA1/START domain
MTVVHDTFIIERTYPHPTAKVFRAWSDPAVKQQWFSGPEEWTKTPHSMDFRVGGSESVTSRTPDGEEHRFTATFFEIVADERIVTTYTMHMNDDLMSVSVATVELEAFERGSRLTYTEQGAYVNPEDQYGPPSRLEGTEGLLDQLGAFLDR